MTLKMYVPENLSYIYQQNTSISADTASLSISLDAQREGQSSVHMERALRACPRMRINSLRTLRRAGCQATRMGINQVPIDFEPYNLFPSPMPLGCYYGNIEDAAAAFLARFATEGWRL